MTRKHYTMLARALNASRPDTHADIWLATVRRVADELERDNSGFDRAKFLFACGA